MDEERIRALLECEDSDANYDDRSEDLGVPLQKKVTSIDLTCFDNKSFQEFQQQIIRKLNVINLKLDQMATDIAQLRSMIEEKPDSQRVDLENIINFNLPLNSIEQLENFEVELTTKEKHASSCAYLEKIGGTSEYDNVKRIFGRVITNELANEYNWLGLKKKTLQHCKLLTLQRASVEISNLESFYLVTH